MKNVYRTYIDVIGYSKNDKNRYSNMAEKENEEDAPMQDDFAREDNQEEMDQAINQEHEVIYTD